MADQSEILKEVLEALKALQVNQTLLASNVDAISGRVNVLAGMKEVQDIAASQTQARPQTPVKKALANGEAELPPHDDVVPQSPSIPATQLEAVAKPNVTSRIILT